jgi:hypothetical protein
MTEDVQGNVESLDALTRGTTFRRHFHQETVAVIADCSRVAMKGNKTENTRF